jgi:hypothetical protein
LYCAVASTTQTTFFKVPIDTGRAEPVGVFPGPWDVRGVSRDGRFLALSENNRFARWEIGEDKPVFGSGEAWASGGEWIVRRTPGVGGGPGSVEIREANNDSAAWRRLVDLPVSNGNLTDDGKSFIYTKTDPDGRRGFYRVATGGGEPQRLGDIPFNGTPSLSADGRHFSTLFSTRENGQTDYFLLENFIPRAAAPAKPGAASVTCFLVC